MLGQYGTDDMAWLLSQSDRPGTVRVERVVAAGDRYATRVFHLPFGKLDNREDLTTFVRAPREAWKAEDVKRLHDGLRAAFRR